MGLNQKRKILRNQDSNQKDKDISLKNPKTFLGPEWANKLGIEFSKPYMESMRRFLKQEMQNGHRIFPSMDKIFNCFKLVDYTDVRVVILGQDPYHSPGQANGLAFAVESNILIPPSLRNIFKEISSSYNLPKNYKFDKTLISWANQGVLCLNTVLTVRENTAFSHRQKGWEIFTDKVLRFIFEKRTSVVFLCWGSAASQKVNNICKEYDKKNYTNSKMQNKSHLILCAPHPSPLSAYRGFFGCGHFKHTNNYFIKNQLPPIKWEAVKSHQELIT